MYLISDGINRELISTHFWDCAFAINFGALYLIKAHIHLGLMKSNVCLPLLNILYKNL